MSFSSILNAPLPSKRAPQDYVTEGMDPLNTDTDTMGDDDIAKLGSASPMAKEGGPGCVGGDCTPGMDIEPDDIGKEFGDFGGFSDDDDISAADILDGEDDDDFDVDGLSDEELNDLDRDLGDDQLAAVMPPEKEITLSPDEEMRADDMMGVVATTALVNREMNAHERAEFAESDLDIQYAINEGFLTRADAEILKEGTDYTVEASYNKNQNVVHLNKKARLNQLYALAINVSAAAHKDPDVILLRKLNRQKKVVRTRLRKKYHSEGLKRMRIYWKRLKSSKSKPLSDLAKKYGK